MDIQKVLFMYNTKQMTTTDSKSKCSQPKKGAMDKKGVVHVDHDAIDHSGQQVQVHIAEEGHDGRRRRCTYRSRIRNRCHMAWEDMRRGWKAGQGSANALRKLR